MEGGRDEQREGVRKKAFFSFIFSKRDIEEFGLPL